MSQAGLVNPTIAPPGSIDFVEDVGAATPIGNILNIVGSNGITTSGAGNTVTISLVTPRISGTVNTVGAVTGDAITLNLGATPGMYTFDAQIAGFDAANNIGVGYTLVGSVRTTGLAAVLVPGQALDQFEEVGMTAANASIVVAGNAAIFRVLGVAGHTMDWTVTTEYLFRP